MVEPFTQTYDSDFMTDESDSLFTTDNYGIEPPQVVLDIIRQYAYLIGGDSFSKRDEIVLLN